MGSLSHLPELKATLTSPFEILTDPKDSKFVEHLKRWTDIDLKTPGAIALPSSEGDIQRIARSSSTQMSTLGLANRQYRCNGLSNTQFLS